MPVALGAAAPEFVLKNQDNSEVALSSYRGSAPVLLVFYPFAFSRICTGELAQLRDDLASYTGAGVEVFAISTDPTYSLKAYADKEGYEFTLLSDFWPHGAASVSYGVFNERAGMAVRGTFLIDVEGVVAFAEVNGPGEPRDQSTWKRAVEAITSAA